jgi:hypothetical protein
MQEARRGEENPRRGTCERGHRTGTGCWSRIAIQELDELIESLPIWPRMETTVTPLTTFEGRMVAVRLRLERLRAKFETA